MIDKKNIKMLLFDLDDTLIGSSSIYKKAVQSLKIDPKHFEIAKRTIKNRLGKDHVSSHNRVLYFKAYLESLDQFSPSASLKITEKYESILAKLIHKEWVSLKREKLLKHLSTKYTLSIATNEVTRMQLIKLSQMDSKGKLFRHVITSEEVGVEKPNSRIFMECFARSGFKPYQVLMIGDSVKNDLKPMKELGSQVLGTKEFLDESKAGESASEYPWISHLEQLKKILE